MPTRRDILTIVAAGGVGAVLPTLADEARTTRVGYFFVGNSTESEQTVEILFECDGDAIFWETYTLDPGANVEPDGFGRAGDYRVHAKWGETTVSQQLESGKRIVNFSLGYPRNVYLLDWPFSRVPRDSRTFGDSRTDSESGG